MNGEVLLQELLSLFAVRIDGADFLHAYPPAGGTRLRRRPAVVGEVEAESFGPGRDELRLCFRIYLPRGENLDRAEELFARMCALVREGWPGFSALSRGGAKPDADTGALTVPCTMTFPRGGDSARGVPVVLGGRALTAASATVAVSRRETGLISVGETVPFASTGEDEYTVTLTGIDTAGLLGMAQFTARIGENPAAVYEGCRWKSVSDVLEQAVFAAARRREEA